MKIIREVKSIPIHSDPIHVFLLKKLKRSLLKFLCKIGIHSKKVIWEPRQHPPALDFHMTKILRCEHCKKEFDY